MKEASGELNMTLVTIIAVAAIGALIYVFLPKITETINKRWETTDEQTKTCARYNENGTCAEFN